MEAYVAAKRIRVGDRTLEVGDPVPFELGRNYKMMLRLGQVTASSEPAKRGPGRPRKLESFDD